MSTMESAMAAATEPTYDTGTIRGLLGQLDQEVTNLQAVFGDLVGDLASVMLQEAPDPNISSIETKDAAPQSELYKNLSDEIDRIIRLNKRIRQTRDLIQI